jgi:uridine phosphorylase
LGLAGSLSAELHLGDMIAPVASVRGDGLTDYWADPKLPAVAHMSPLSALNQAARQRDLPISNGIFFTSATWYKEPEFIGKWSELGVVGIQMELAQYYLLAYLHRKKVAGLYVISDLPLEGEAVWETGFRQDNAILEGCYRSVDVLLGRSRCGQVKQFARLEQEKESGIIGPKFQAPVRLSFQTGRYSLASG